jgi:nucleoid-associated protein YgaU
MTKLPLLVTVRALVLVAVMGALGAGVWELARPPLVAVVARPGDLAFAEALEALCATLLVVGWLWLQAAALVLAVAAAARVARRPRLAGLADRVAYRTTPAALRRLVIAGCGVALSASAVVLPASATTRAAPHARPGPSARLEVPDLAGLPLPDRTAGPHLSHRVAGSPQRWLTVHPGDSLWAIARRLLPAGADDHEVALASGRLASANRTTIGADPDLILPGTRLRVPDHIHRREPT